MQYAASILEGCSALEEGLFLVAIEIIGFLKCRSEQIETQSHFQPVSVTL